MLDVVNGNLIQSIIDHRNRPKLTSQDIITSIYYSIPDQNITPSLDKVLRCIQIPPERAKVIIIGQDPYPGDGVATGLAFSHDGLVRSNGSGKSIYYIAKEIYRSAGLDLPNNLSGNLDHWQAQGVVLLNSALTTTIGKIGRHYNYWRDCVRAIIQEYLTVNPRIVVLCLGTVAKQLVESMKIEVIFYTQHPNAPNTKLVGSDVFRKINEVLGPSYIDWGFLCYDE